MSRRTTMPTTSIRTLVTAIALTAVPALASEVEARCTEGDQIVQIAEGGRRQIAAQLQKLAALIPALEQAVGADHDSVRKLKADYERLQQQATNLVRQADKNAEELCTSPLNHTAKRIEREVNRIAEDVETELNRTVERIEREVNRITKDIEKQLNRVADEAQRTARRVEREVKRFLGRLGL